MASTVTVLGFPASDKVLAKAQIEALDVAASDILIWQDNNMIYVGKVVHT